MEFKETNLPETLQEQEDKKNKAKELRCVAENEIALVNEKYKELLDEFDSEKEYVQRMVSAHEAKWNPLLADYKKEFAPLKKEYKKLMANTSISEETAEILILKLKIKVVDAKYKETTDAYKIELDKLKPVVDEHNKKWNARLAEYNKEVAVIEKNYKRMVKAL